MSEQELLNHFEELEAGLILGDLSAEEMNEWQELSDAQTLSPDISLELTAAAIETAFLQPRAEPLPAKLAERLRQAFPLSLPGSKPAPAVIVTPVWQRIVNSPLTPWSIAAAFALLFAIGYFSDTTDSGSSQSLADRSVEFSPQESRDQLLGKASDLVESEFGGLKSYDQMSGKVIWSDKLQEGYMTLTDLPANDPSKNQYQLWIVDPARDEKPVDGGVFDIPEGEATAVVRIKNPLLVTNPQAFVITLEQPGGVVVSKQGMVVASASAS